MGEGAFSMHYEIEHYRWAKQDGMQEGHNNAPYGINSDSLN